MLFILLPPGLIFCFDGPFWPFDKKKRFESLEARLSHVSPAANSGMLSEIVFCETDLMPQIFWLIYSILAGFGFFSVSETIQGGYKFSK